MRLSEKLQEKRTTPYKEVAKKLGVSVIYVGQIARGYRVPKRNSGKGVEVLRELERMVGESESKMNKAV